MTQQATPSITKTIRVPAGLHEQVLARLGPESFTAYIVRLIAEDLSRKGA